MTKVLTRPVIELWPVQPTRMPLWRSRVAAARERGGFTEEECWLALSTETCALGEVHEFKRDYDNRRQGALWIACKFYGAVGANNFAHAERLLDRLDELYK